MEFFLHSEHGVRNRGAKGLANSTKFHQIKPALTNLILSNEGGVYVPIGRQVVAVSCPPPLEDSRRAALKVPHLLLFAEFFFFHEL